MATNWISVKNGIPRTSEPVRVKTVDGKEHDRWYMDQYGQWHTETYRLANEEVKGWTPLDDLGSARENQAYYFPQFSVDDSKSKHTKSHQIHDVGIYVLFKDNQIVYVGQSRHIQHRLYEHQTRHDVDFDSYMIFETDDRMRIEAFLIQLLNPICNIALSNGTDWR